LLTFCYLFFIKVTRESLKEQIFDVSHHGLVKEKLKDLLTSEIVAITEMQHGEASSDKNVDEEGMKCNCCVSTEFAEGTFYSHSFPNSTLRRGRLGRSAVRLLARKLLGRGHWRSRSYG
jgi:hypothetical protein